MFLKVGKQGSTLAGIMDAFSIAISIALQYGVPLEAFVQKFTNMRFEPAGMTDDPDIRMAQSIMDYIFRRLALDYLPFDTRAELGIFTAEERARPSRRSTATTPARRSIDDDVEYVESLAQSAPIDEAVDAEVDEVAGRQAAGTAEVHSSTELLESSAGHGGRRAAVHELRHQDAPGRQLLRLRGLRQHQRLQLMRTVRKCHARPLTYCRRSLLPGAAAASE